MKRVLQGLGAVLGLILLAGVGFVGWNWAVLSVFPNMPSSYEAKEYCSCRFVSERPADFCDRFVRQSVVPTQGRTVDEQGRRVTAKALWTTNSARWVDRQHGCVLE